MNSSRDDFINKLTEDGVKSGLEILPSEIKGLELQNLLNQTGRRFELIKRQGQSDLKKPYKSTSVIVYGYGILFTGEPEGVAKISSFFSGVFSNNNKKKKEWKQLLFEEMLSMQLLADTLIIKMKYMANNNNYECVLKIDDSKNMKKWESFICCVYKNVKWFENRKGIHDLQKAFKDVNNPNKDSYSHHYSCIKYNMGGQRKTKRSKCNKKCKRRTRRS